MPTLVLFLFRFARLLFRGHAAVALENAALRLQLAAFRGKRRRPRLTSLDRLFRVGLSLLWKDWRSPLVYVQPDTVVRWQRERFRRFCGTVVQGEGIEVSERTVSRILRKLPRPPSQTWKTFLHNHLSASSAFTIGAADNAGRSGR